MATWWEITFTGDPTETDLEHVAGLIREGFTSGQLIEEPAALQLNGGYCQRCGEYIVRDDALPAAWQPGVPGAWEADAGPGADGDARRYCDPVPPYTSPDHVHEPS